MIAKRQTLRPLSNSDSDVRDYSRYGMKSSASSIVSFSVMGMVTDVETIDESFTLSATLLSGLDA